MKGYTEEFISFLTHIKKASTNTVDSYKRDLQKFLSYLEDNNIQDASTASSETIRRYISELSLTGKSASTIARVTSSIKTYYKFLNSINKCRTLPELSTQDAVPTKSLPLVLELKEIEALLEQPDMKDIKGIRDRAMLELLYATGIRVSELISLSIDDINLQLGFLKVASAKTERTVPIHRGALKVLSLYLNQVRPAIITELDNTILFSNMNGTPMTRQGFWKLLKGYADSAGINKDITPHTIRHTFAYHLIENGADLYDVKEMLGHADISSTQVYTQIMKSKYAKSYSNFHPFAR